jgi:hypothetical protein
MELEISGVRNQFQAIRLPDKKKELEINFIFSFL